MTGGTQWLPPLQLSPRTVASAAAEATSVAGVLDVLGQLAPDDYLEFMVEYYRQGLARFGRHWGYMDLLTVLHAAAALLHPRDYIEIGVRRGRSMAVVASVAPECAIVGFDLWVADYAGMPNPGPDFVRGEMARIGHRGILELVSGDSRETLAPFLRRDPDRAFDLATVDGDHSAAGAADDLALVLPRLRMGGLVVLDDIAHPAHPQLRSVWDHAVAADPRFASFAYDEIGYGVAFAVRRS